MKSLLVPVDFSGITEDVIDTAIDFARAFQGRVTLLHVLQPPVVASEFALPVEVLQEALVTGEKAATAKVESYVSRFQAAGVTAEARVLHGPPGSLIVEEAERVKADFVIMGSHGHGKLYDLIVGSTANRVIKKAKCGVILLPPGDREY